MPTTLYLYEALQRLLEYAELDANFKNLRTTADAAAPKVGTALTSGVTLGNTAQAGSTVLDWYEEGTFTPAVYGTTTAGVGTYTSQVGYFTRVGREVQIRLSLAWSAHTGSGYMRVSGLPFTNSVLPYSYTELAVWYNGLLVGTGKQLAAYIPMGSTSIILSACDPTGGSAVALSVDTESTGLMLSGSYLL